METAKISQLYDLGETIAAELFAGLTYPWEALPKISDFIKKLGPTLDPEVYEQRGENIWVAKSATVAPTAFLNGPLIIDEDAEIRHCAFIRGNAIVGKGSVVGNSTELKNVVIFNSVQVPHYNYVGDSILGYKSHMGAGSITSNVKSDKTLYARTESSETDHSVFQRGAFRIIQFFFAHLQSQILHDLHAFGRNVAEHPHAFIGLHTVETTNEGE